MTIAYNPKICLDCNREFDKFYYKSGYIYSHENNDCNFVLFVKCKYEPYVESFDNLTIIINGDEIFIDRSGSIINVSNYTTIMDVGPINSYEDAYFYLKKCIENLEFI